MIHFDFKRPIREVVVVGLGGTGSQIARSLARMVYDMRARGLETPRLYFVDPDRVEVKNVGRQMFTLADVGEPKAELLARRFNFALGLDIQYRNEVFTDVYGWPNMSVSGTLIVGAVDNHHARRAIHESQFGLWLDCGNHFDTGQVILGTSHQRITLNRYTLDRELARGTLTHLPTAALLFPALLEPPTESATVADVSCADLVAQGEQHLLVNEYVALVAASYVYKLLHRQPVTSFMTYVDAGGMMRPVPITRENLAVYLPDLTESA